MTDRPRIVKKIESRPRFGPFSGIRLARAVSPLHVDPSVTAAVAALAGDNDFVGIGRDKDGFSLSVGYQRRFWVGDDGSIGMNPGMVKLISLKYGLTDKAADEIKQNLETLTGALKPSLREGDSVIFILGQPSGPGQRG